VSAGTALQEMKNNSGGDPESQRPGEAVYGTFNIAEYLAAIVLTNN
jgi:hypothetical protein